MCTLLAYNFIQSISSAQHALTYSRTQHTHVKYTSAEVSVPVDVMVTPMYALGAGPVRRPHAVCVPPVPSAITNDAEGRRL